MAVNDDAVLTAAVGHVFSGAVDNAAPSPTELASIDPLDPGNWTATGWTDIGHTSRGDMPEFGFEGGETEVKGTWQSKKLREVTTEDPVDYLTLTLQQFDEANLELYYGPNSSATAGVFGVSGATTTVESAFLCIIVDGATNLGFWVPKASVKRDDAISLPVDDFAAFPIKCTFLNSGALDLFTWINEDLFPNV